jgi:hydroxyacylglutathione hydrolase
MLNIRQFRYASDNLGYLVFGEKEAMAIDGGAVEEMLSFLERRQLTLLYVTNTHDHFDHLTGNDALIRKSGAHFLKRNELRDQHEIVLDDGRITVHYTPGHTDDSFCFMAGSVLMTGDTLFNGTIGNNFSGNDRNFYQSIKRIMQFPLHTVICAGHDYVQDAMAFAKALEPDNLEVDAFLSRYDPGHVYSTLAAEMQINPYLRLNDGRMIEILKAKGYAAETEWERWQALMSLE